MTSTNTPIRSRHYRVPNAVIHPPTPQNPRSARYRVTAYPASISSTPTGVTEPTWCLPSPVTQACRQASVTTDQRVAEGRRGAYVTTDQVAALPLPVAAPLPLPATTHTVIYQDISPQVAGSGQARRGPETGTRRHARPGRAATGAPRVAGREAGREARGSEGVFPTSLPTRLPPVDLRKGGKGGQGGTSPPGPETARNAVSSLPRPPPSLAPCALSGTAGTSGPGC